MSNANLIKRLEEASTKVGLRLPFDQLQQLLKEAAEALKNGQTPVERTNKKRQRLPRRTTMRGVEMLLEREGIKLEFTKGEGYFYFTYDQPGCYDTRSIMVNSLKQLTLDQWLEEGREYHKELKAKGF